MKLLLALCFVIFCFFPAAAQTERFVRPFDEAKKDASFLAFRTRLIKAVEKRDAKYLLSVLDPKILNSYGGVGGIREFKTIWKIESPQSKLWDELLTVLRNGGKLTRESGSVIFSAPYTFNGLPENLDFIDHQMIFGNNVNLRAEPVLNARVVGRLSYNIVKVDYENSVKRRNSEDEYEWLKVETLGGKRGFVKSEFVRSAIDYRAIFEKKKGGWKMTIFVAGD